MCNISQIMFPLFHQLCTSLRTPKRIHLHLPPLAISSPEPLRLTCNWCLHPPVAAGGLEAVGEGSLAKKTQSLEDRVLLAELSWAAFGVERAKRMLARKEAGGRVGTRSFLVLKFFKKYGFFSLQRQVIETV